MLTIPATVCITGARTKRRLSFASIRIARGCPGPLQGLGMKEHVRPVSLGAAAHRLRGGGWGRRPRDASPFPRGTSLRQGLAPTRIMSGDGFSSPILHGPPQGAAALSCHPSPCSAPASGDVCLQRPTGAPMAPSLCGCRVGTPCFEICFNHIYTV